MKMNKAYLLTGSNIGDKKNYLSLAMKKIEESCGVVINRSSIYQTEAWGLQDQDAFLNQVLQIRTSLSAEKLLQQILSIEESLGRKRGVKYGPRVIDIDILLFNDEIIKEDGLSIPHPEMQNRRFVLTPLNELAPTLIHPSFHQSIEELLKNCPDQLNVQKI